MSLSTLTMQCNSSGWSSPSRGSEFGVVSYDWSNAKDQWAAMKPMDCEERLQRQAHMTKKRNPSSKVFVYRNLVKALPWFSSVREKLDDARYSSWFLHFDTSKKPSAYHVPPCALENSTKCSIFYHDQEQTPEVPTPDKPHPDGKCTQGNCDCGFHPCGEYLFDHRNGSQLRQWIVDSLINGPAGLGDKNIDGFFIDDYWCSNLLCQRDPTIAGCPCDDPVQGPTEVEPHSQLDMGLSDEDVRDLTLAWNKTMEAAQRAILKSQGYTWSLIKNQENANASPEELKADSCFEQLREACNATSKWQNHPMLFGVQHNGSNMTQFNQDLAFFLLARGKYSWLGWGTWGMTWPFNAEPAHGELPPLPHGVPRPPQLDLDYGMPLEICHEEERGVFKRSWTKAEIQLDCNNFVAKIDMEELDYDKS
eukprot:CAMPEP_0184488090 /NCGR_PEP_ID=MMETSP0113_2-20130426/10521_1 /TAXON_ID=91329 /ORGANISM="Norrisiella sphaerica, Strain BC52" /LENGTH=420 /DNA_ID=CAMNT_0026870567 /DNA_START=299 /DNA_END=1561 /DNA_ORIENTATION=-